MSRETYTRPNEYLRCQECHIEADRHVDDNSALSYYDEVTGKDYWPLCADCLETLITP